MMTAIAVLDIPLRAVLFGDVHAGQAADLVQTRLDTDEVTSALQDVPVALRGFARAELAKVIERISDMDAIDVLALGWRKYRRLSDAAERTLASPHSRELVELASHRMARTHPYDIDVLVDGTRRATINCKLELVADVIGVCGVVTGGRLVTLRAGHIDLEATLTCEGFEVGKGSHRIDIPGEASLGEGVALVGQD